MPSINDLRNSYYGGGQDAEIAFLQSMSDASLTVGDLMRVALRAKSLRRTGAIAESYDRSEVTSGNVGLLVSGRLHLVEMPLSKGQVVTSITFKSGTTAAVNPTAQHFHIWSAARAKLAVTNDDGATAWASNTEKTLALSSQYTVATSGLHYIGILVAAGTVPSFLGHGPSSLIAGAAPILSGSADTGLTDLASLPTTAAALTATSVLPYCYVS